MNWLYPFAYLVSLTALIGWMRWQDKEGLNTLLRFCFWFGLFFWATALISAEADWSYKLQIAFRDLLILGVVPFLVVLFGRIAPALFWVALLPYFIFVGYYQSILQATFQKVPAPITNTEETSPTAVDDRSELLVALPHGDTPASLGKLTERYRLSWTPAFQPARADDTTLDDYYLVNVPNELDWQLVLDALENSGAIIDVEDNELVALGDWESVSSGEYDLSKLGLDDPDLARMWSFRELSVEQLFDALAEFDITPREPALIAILDTGVDARHEDLAANYVSTQSKYDRDGRGHGTHCAGIAAAVSNNGRGIAGMSRDNRYVRVTSVQVLSQFGMGDQAGIIRGMIEAADAGADVISMSLGARASAGAQQAYTKAVAYANKQGAIVIAAAGNNNGDARQIVPAGVPGVIAVSAVDTVLHKAGFSNRVDGLRMGIAAPGTEIYSTIPNDRYAAYNGTSMAAPHVAGLVGLLKSIRPELTTEQVYTLLEMTGKETKDPALTGKLIQPGAAVRYLLQD